MKSENAESIVFIVDDDPTNLHILVDALSRKGFNVAIAKNGEAALNQVEAVNPDIILLDVLMPGIDGFETCRRLKKHAATTEIPVIFMTALSETVDKIKGFEVGGVDYITKPFQYEELFARVNAHLTIRQQHRYIQEQNERLQELNASKDKFFSIIAHDLRNPFSGFLSFIQLMEESVNNGNKDRLTKIITMLRTSAEHLAALLENLLTWSRFQRGLIEYQPHQIEVEHVVAWNIKLLSQNAGQKQITLKNSVPQETFAYADLNMIDMIIRNLLSNAIKFTQTGGQIDVAARQAATKIEVSVSDTGTGISEEKLPKLFRIDARLQRAGTAGEKGTGLGLILCKEFVERHGGSIRVESEVGQGSCFTVSLPWKEANTSN